MGRRNKQANALQVQASRVEKSRRSQKKRQVFPEWFYRVQRNSYMQGRDVRAHDFDEDLSELEEDEEPQSDEFERECECSDENSECDCGLEENDGTESERTYDGSDGEYYYELKEERQERKREKQRHKLREQKEKIQAREFEATQEETVRIAYKSLKKDRKAGKKVPVGLLADQDFRLFCSDHVDHFYSSEYYPTKRVDFYHPRHITGALEPDSETDKLFGLVYLNADTTCEFGPFRPWKHARSKSLKVKSSDDQYELSFKFIGNGYLKLKVSKEMVFMHPYNTSSAKTPTAAPEVFEFVGIWRDWEKEKAEQREKMAKVRRPPSPRESWFEMTHPMGWWHQSMNF